MQIGKTPIPSRIFPERERGRLPIGSNGRRRILMEMKTIDRPAQSSHRLRERELPLPDTTCKIVFFYEDFDAAIRCRKTFDSVSQQFGNGRPVAASSWSFSMLGVPEFNPAILSDAEGADVFVVAARGDRALSPRVATWIERCVKGGNRNGTAVPMLVALHPDGLEPMVEAEPLCSSLAEIARRQGAGSMCGRDLKEPRPFETPITMLPPRSANAAGILRDAPNTTPATPRRWGIND